MLLLSGLAKPTVALVGAGAACIFIGVAMLAPAVARPLADAIGRPLVRLGVAGALGRENSLRSPQPTAQTASALMIGLALVAAMAVFGASAQDDRPGYQGRRRDSRRTVHRDLSGDPLEPWRQRPKPIQHEITDPRDHPPRRIPGSATAITGVDEEPG